MIYVDLHTHSNFCDGKDSPEDMVKSAIDKGVKKIGIVVHAYVDFDTSYCVDINRIDEFKVEISRLKKKYSNQIDVLCGVELEAFSKQTAVGFDFSIGSVHYFSDGNNYYPIDLSEKSFCSAVDTIFDGDFYAAAEWYFETVADYIKKVKPSIIGHFDLITKFNEDNKLFDTKCDRYVKAYEKALNELLKLDIPFEINSGAISRGYRSEPYPSIPIVNYIKKHGGGLILSSDAHSKNNVAYQFEKWSEIYGLK